MDHDWALSPSKQSSLYLHEVGGEPGYPTHHDGFGDQDPYLLHQLDNNIFDGSSSTPHHVDSNYGTPVTAGASTGSNSRIDTTPGAFSMESSMFILPEGVPIDDEHQPQSTAYPPTGGIKTPGLLANKHLAHDSQKAFVSPILPGQNEKSYNDQHYYHTHRSGGDTPQQHQPPSQHVRPDAVFTPLVSPAVTPHDSQVNVNKAAPVQTSFEPLTSPALNARPDIDRRRSSSSAYGTAEDQPSHKRRTPHGTPVMGPNGSTRKVKQSPSLKGRSHRSGASLNSFEKLPESLVAPPRSSGDSTPMYPPQRKQVMDFSNGGDGAAPAMMGFTMGRLSEQQPHGHSRSSSSSANTSPVIGTQGSKGRFEKPDYKRTSHKIAEQGRRNRMNTAVQELASLIPPSFNSEESVPSKANTVEMASKYIRALLSEIDEMRRK